MKASIPDDTVPNLIPIETISSYGIKYEELSSQGIKSKTINGAIVITQKDLNRILSKHHESSSSQIDVNICFLDVLSEEYKNFLFLFPEYVKNTKRRIFLARKYIFFLTALGLQEELKLSKKTFFKIQFSLKKHISTEDKVYFKNSRSFYKFVEDLNTDNLLSKIKHSGKGVIKESRYGEHEEWVQLEIEERFKRNKSLFDIAEEINPILQLKGLPKISESDVANRITPKLHNLYSLDKYGFKHVRQKILGYENREKPDYLMQVVEGDGSKYQIIGRNHVDNSVMYISFYAILDLCSGKIVGVNLGPVENGEMVLNAYYDMAMKTCHLPSVIRIDKAGPYRRPELKTLMDRTKEQYGCLWLDHKPQDPGVNGNIEKFFQDFHKKLVHDHPDCPGLSMVSTTAKYSLKREVMERAYKNPEALLTDKELMRLLRNHLALWNEGLARIKNTSRNLSYETGEFLDAQPIQHPQIANLFWKFKTPKFENQRFQVNNKEYELTSFDHTLKMSGEYFNVYYDDSNIDFVYVFTKDDEFIGKAGRKPTWINDPKHINGEDRLELDKRLKARNAIIPEMKKRSKAKSKRLEEIRSNDPVISHYMNTKKEESNCKLLDVHEYNFNLPKKKKTKKETAEEELTKLTFMGNGGFGEFISEGKQIDL